MKIRVFPKGRPLDLSEKLYILQGVAFRSSMKICVFPKGRVLDLLENTYILPGALSGIA